MNPECLKERFTMNNRHDSGFTLFELLIVIFIIGLLGTIAVPNMNMIFTKNKMRTSTSAVTSTLYLARMKAINQGSLHGVEFFVDGSFHLVQDPYSTKTVIGNPYQLESGVSFTEISFLNQLAVFDEYGQLDKNCLPTGQTIGIVRLTDGTADTTKVEVTLVTGRIRETIQ